MIVAKRTSIVAVMTVSVVASAGCNVDGRWTHIGGPAGPIKLVSDTDAGLDMSIAPAREVDLVENVLAHRQAYRRGLKQLGDYYRQQGYAEKATWADYELEGTRRVKAFRYLLDAEVPSGVLRATEEIADADEMYTQGQEMMRKGGHGVPAIYREDRMVQAGKVLRALIERFPTSDKIDDAAFLLGEIHKEYLPNQDQLAVNWYERAWTWDPNTPHPARFQAAVVYQYRLHDRAKALELYRKVVERESSSASNVRFATRQIEQLTSSDG